MECRRLFTPTKISRLELKNRIVLPAMVSRIASPDRLVTQRTIDYYSARAAGGCGLIIVEASHVRSDGRVIWEGLGIDDDRCIPGLRVLATAIHEAGSKVVIQLNHAGRFTSVSEIGVRQIAPSAIPSTIFGEIPRELPIKEIPELVESWVQAARRAQEAGFDGIELHGAHSYLLAEFLSPYFNHRKDDYGGDLYRRARLPMEIISAIRKKVGDNFVIIYRMNGVEYIEGGMTHDEAKKVAPLIVEAGLDALHISCGPFESERLVAVAPMEVKQGWTADYFGGIKSQVNVPVIGVNRIADCRVAERILENGQADLVAMGRALLCDPDLPNKASRGAFHEIRRCTGCTQCCQSLYYPASSIVCMQNASLCRERERAPVPAKEPRKVMVIGGGPGGLEAARVAALRGHTVNLFEANPWLGGQLSLAAAAPGRSQLGMVTRYLKLEMERLGGKIRLNQRVSLDTVRQENPDVIVVATGARSFVPPIPGVMARNVVTAEAVLTEEAKVGNKILVLGGGRVGLSTASWLAHHGKRVSVLEVLESALSQIQPWNFDLPFLVDRLKHAKVNIYRCTSVREIRDGAVFVDHEGEEALWGRHLVPMQMTGFGFDRYREIDGEELASYDTFVLAIRRVSNNELADQLAAISAEVHVVGDAVKPREVSDAINEGNQVGLRI